ncbi:MAG: pyridoxal-phosphate dependent enzyme [Gemmatimonadetes bacterium]|nr:pyridoxal-phosphate dependent enzyme [Gemmatimonadota bacterium]
MRRLSLSAIARAASSIDPVFLHSPQYRAESLGEVLGVDLVVKVETINPIRSFKGRGADFFVSELGDDATPLVCASAGNFGQGLAHAARRRGLSLVVFASEHANPLKVDRMRALGAEVRQVGRDFDEAKAAGRAYAAEIGGRYVEDGRDVAITEGAGSIGVELARWAAPIDTLLVPLGNGALLGGVATWFKAYRPETQIVGVCAEGAPSLERSWRTGHAVETASADTIADGIAVRVPIPEAVSDIQALVDDVVLVHDGQTIDAMRRLFVHLGIVVEPAGAVGIAALLAERPRYAGSRVATILCGGNLTPAQVTEFGLVAG